MSSPPSISDLATVSDVKTTESANKPKNTNNPKEPSGKPRERARFTRGEKCLCIHLAVTFGLLLVLFIIYCVHLCIVKHYGDDMFAGWLRAGPVTQKDINAKEQSDPPVGLVYVLGNTEMCNCLLLRAKWSLAPAHCVAARSDPDLAYVLPKWRIVYAMNGYSDAEEYIETHIQRSVPHPHFNRDDFQNNIGLFEHADSINLISYANLNEVAINEETLMANATNLYLIGWENSWHLHGHVVQNPVLPFTMEKCKLYVTPVVDLRQYEYCVAPRTKLNVSITPGAILAMKSQYVGMFSWGESTGRGVPFVILDLPTYKNWILHVISI